MKKNFFILLSIIAVSFGLFGCSLNINTPKSPTPKQVNQLAKNDIQIIDSGNQMRVILPTDDFFIKATSNLKPEKENDIRMLSGVIQNFQPNRIYVKGFSDNTLTAKENKLLSKQRAEKIMGLLWAFGLPHNILAPAEGYGSEEPIASNLTSYGKIFNRRIEILLER